MYTSLPNPVAVEGVGKVPWQAVSSVSGGFLIHLTLGMLYTWAVITAPVTSYLRQYDPSITYDDTIMIYSITLTVQSGMMVVGGMASEHFGARYSCMFGSVFLILSMFLASFCRSIAQYIYFHAIPFGIGIGLCYTPPIAVSVLWLPELKGVVTGTIMCGLGVGAVVFGLVCTAIVNPNHISVNSEGVDANYFPSDSTVIQQVPRMYRIVSLCFCIMLPVGCFLLQPPNSHTNTAAPKPEEDQSNHPESRSTSSEHRVYNILHHDQDAQNTSEIEMGASRHALLVEHKHRDDEEIDDGPGRHEPSETNKSPSSQICESQDEESSKRMAENNQSLCDIAQQSLTWHLILCFTCTTGGGMYLLGTYKTFAQLYIQDEKFLSVMGSCSTLSSSIGRIVWGWISDRYGTVNTLICAIGVFTCIIYTFPFVIQYGEFPFAVWTILMFFLEAANFAIYFPIVVMLFGQQTAASNYGFIVTMYSSLFMLISYSIAHSHFGFYGVCCIVGSIALFGLVMLLFLRKRIIQ